MADFKIFVKDEAASKEARELFFDLGASLGNGDKHAVLVPNIMGLAVIDGLINFVFNDVVFADIEQCKELTLPELRDLVVLKRNDRRDATHTDQDGWHWYISSNGDSYVFGAGNPNGLHQWDKSPLDHVDLKPIKNIESEAMKEYLNDKYELITSKEELSNLIKVPEGAEIAYIYGDNTYFAKPVNDGGGVLMWILGEDTQWDTTGWNSWQSLINTGLELLWQRSKPKEYLDPEDGYSLVTAVHALPHWIEVPDGADECIVQMKIPFFYKNDNMYFIRGEWVECNKKYQKASDFLRTSFNADRVWQRNKPTQQHEKLVSIPVEDEAENNTTYEVQRQIYPSLEGDTENNTMKDSDFMNLIGQILGNKFTDVQKTLINLALNK